MNTRILLVVLLTFPGIFLSQNRPSGPELLWSLAHPIAAVRIKKISTVCQPLYDSLVRRGIPDQYPNGGKLDALRHVYFMAAFAQKIKPSKLKKLGIAHELGNRKNFMRHQFEEGELADSLSCEMDLYNNLIGIEIGKNAQHNSVAALLRLVLLEIEKGNAIIMLRNKKGAYLNCEGEIIEPQVYSNKWKIPKCLVKSNAQAKD